MGHFLFHTSSELLFNIRDVSIQSYLEKSEIRLAFTLKIGSHEQHEWRCVQLSHPIF
jgi:hypothetical protein